MLKSTNSTSDSSCLYLCRKADPLLGPPVADSPLASPRPAGTPRTRPPSDGCRTTTTGTSWSKSAGSAGWTEWRFWGTDGQSGPTAGFSRRALAPSSNAHWPFDSLHTYSSLSQWEDLTCATVKTEGLTTIVSSCLLQFLLLCTGGVFPLLVCHFVPHQHPPPFICHPDNKRLSKIELQ